MPIVKMDLPEGYELIKDFKGRKFALIYRDFDDVKLVADWKQSPFVEEVLIAIDREKKKGII